MHHSCEMWGVKINKYVYHLNVQYILREILKYISSYSCLLWITKKTACCLLNANVACFPSAFEGHTIFGEVVSWGVTAQISHSWEEFKCSFAGSFYSIANKIKSQKKRNPTTVNHLIPFINACTVVVVAMQYICYDYRDCFSFTPFRYLSREP